MFTAFRYQGKYTSPLDECATDILRGTGEQHTNRNRKKASQEYLVNVLHPRNAWSPLLFSQSNPSPWLFWFYLAIVCLSHPPPSLAEHVYVPFVAYNGLFSFSFSAYFRDIIVKVNGDDMDNNI